MSYATLMVHLELGKSNAGLLKVAGDLAERSHSRVLAVAACQPLLATSAAAGYISGEVVEMDEAEIEKEAREAQVELKDLLGHRAAQVDWRCVSTAEALANFVCREARSADLILTAPDHGGSLFPNTRRVKIADLVMHAGRPVLLVPEGIEHLSLDRVLLAWKDSREARRAALDAIPLLELAGHVTVAEVVPEDEAAAAHKRLADVIGWLAAHGIPAEPLIKISHGSDAEAVAELAHADRAGVVVAGAYGHSRLHEWILGGVTMDLLMNPNRVTLLSR